MKIELPSLDGRKGEFAHLYEPGEFELGDDQVKLLGTPSISGRIVQKGRRTFVEGRLKARTQVECNRCLKVIDKPVDNEFRLEYVTPIDYEHLGGKELSEEDLRLSIFDGEVIDIDAIVREQILLAVPSYAICSEDCKGLCPVCRSDRNEVDCECFSK